MGVLPFRTLLRDDHKVGRRTYVQNEITYCQKHGPCEHAILLGVCVYETSGIEGRYLTPNIPKV